MAVDPVLFVFTLRSVEGPPMVVEKLYERLKMEGLTEIALCKVLTFIYKKGHTFCFLSEAKCASHFKLTDIYIGFNFGCCGRF